MLERGWRLKSRGRSRAVAGTRGQRFAGRIPTAGGALSASEPGRVFVLLVVVALLLCHGAFGYAHQLSPPDTQASHVAHASGGHHSVPDRSTGEAHTGGSYFATLLALFFGAFLLLGGRVEASTRLPAPATQNRARRARTSLPPRGPTLSSLQVFRL